MESRMLTRKTKEHAKDKIATLAVELSSESDRNETNSSSDSYEPASRNESYDESELAKGSNHEPPQVEQRNRENTPSASSDPRTYFALADFVQSQTKESTMSDRSFCIKGHDIVERNEAESNKDMYGENNDALLPISEADQESCNGFATGLNDPFQLSNHLVDCSSVEEIVKIFELKLKVKKLEIELECQKSLSIVIAERDNAIKERDIALQEKRISTAQIELFEIERKMFLKKIKTLEQRQQVTLGRGLA